MCNKSVNKEMMYFILETYGNHRFRKEVIEYNDYYL